MLSQAAYKVEQLLGHNANAETVQDVSNPAVDRSKYGHASETMKALCWIGKNRVELRTVPKPIVVESEDVVLKVTGSTVCGSDLHLLHGAVLQLQSGDILGHEFAGEVESVGEGVTKLKPGDRVVASFQFACGDCYYCNHPDGPFSSQCEKTNSNKIEYGLYGGNTAAMAGYSHLCGGMAGGQAEYVRVPKADVNLLKIPDDVPDEKALYLSDVVCTSWHCVVDTGVRKGDVVAIFGAGAIGQLCAHFAFLNGADRVIMVDNNWRLDFVKSKEPRVELVNFSQLGKGESVTSTLKKMTGGRGPDVCLECAAGEYAKGWVHALEMAAGLETDTSEILNEMITSVRSFGRIGITGIYLAYTNHFNIGAVMERGIRLIGNGQAPVHRYWEDLLKKIQAGEIDPLNIVTQRVDIDDIVKVYDKFDSRAEGIQKVFVQTKFSKPPCTGAPSLTKY